MPEMLLQIEKAVYGGDGLARTPEGEVRLIPFVLPGETIRQQTERAAESTFELLSRAPERVEPQCVHFGQCGGCQYQMASYDAQLRMKKLILEEILKRAEVDVPEEAHVWPSPEPWGYRNRVRFRTRATPERPFEVGYNVRNSREFLPVVMCLIAAPLLWSAATTLMRIAAEQPQAAGWLLAASHIEVACNEDATRLMVHLLCAGPSPREQKSFERLAQLLKAELPLATLAASRLHVASGRAMETLASWGPGGLTYTVDEERFWLTPGSFFQINRLLLPTMLQLVCGEREGALAWDLFAGVGLFSHRLARRFQAVTAVEANSSALPELRRGLPGPRHQAVEETTAAYLRRSVTQRERPNLIVLDPPRAGAGEDACQTLVRLAPAQIVYVSCDPTTLARDLQVLTAERYRIEELHLVDLFPQTYHLETVMVLTRKDVQG